MSFFACRLNWQNNDFWQMTLGNKLHASIASYEVTFIWASVN